MIFNCKEKPYKLDNLYIKQELNIKYKEPHREEKIGAIKVKIKRHVLKLSYSPLALLISVSRERANLVI